MIFDIILSFAILGYAQLNSQEDRICPELFLTVVDIHLFYRQIICIVQSFFVFHVLQFVAPLVNSVMILDMTEDWQPFG